MFHHLPLAAKPVQSRGGTKERSFDRTTIRTNERRFDTLSIFFPTSCLRCASSTSSGNYCLGKRFSWEIWYKKPWICLLAKSETKNKRTFERTLRRTNDRIEMQ